MKCIMFSVGFSSKSFSCIYFLLSTTIFKYALCFIVQDHVIPANNKGIVMTNTWSVKLRFAKGEKNLFDKANKIAAEFNMVNLGQVGELVGHYVFTFNSSISNSLQYPSNFAENDQFSYSHTLNHEEIEWYSQQELLRRTKRVPFLHKLTNISFADPLFTDQWHLHNHINKIDCNVTGVWNYGIAGKGVVVAIVDDGVQWQHPDLKENYCSAGSFDLNSDDNDPTPVPDKDDENKHGTRCAGEVAAVSNTVCGVGIAYKAKFSGIRVLDGPMTDSLEATAFNKRINVNDVYSCSWGPEDDGKTVDGPRSLAQAALQHGVVAGRSGFGSIFVVASGNGGIEGDNCNFDGYSSSIYTITIAAVDEFGRVPSYSEQCLSMLACTVSSGEGMARNIVTTDWTLGHEQSQCTYDHTGTSAATPLAAGMIALMLEARPCLTWRDVQHIIVMTAKPVYKIANGLDRTLWYTNAAGFSHSNNHGFGLLDSWRLVNAARTWKSVPWLSSISPTCSMQQRTIPNDGKTPLVVETNVTAEQCRKHLINTLEQIRITISLNHPSRGQLKFKFICPSGTISIVSPRKKDISSVGFRDWSFSTVRCWGELPYGRYQLKIFDTIQSSGASLGELLDWKMTIYGSQITSNDIENRKKIIRNSLSGNFLTSDSNYSVNCPVGQPELFDITTAISYKTLKLVLLISAFVTFCAFYYPLEMAFCNLDDKSNQSPLKDDLSSQCDDSGNNYSSTALTENVTKTLTDEICSDALE